MIQANELRIGNLIMVEEIQEPQQVVDVMCDSINTIKVQNAHYGMVHPIPLTEEWLVKLGFVEEDNHWFFIKYTTDFEYYIYTEEMKICYNSSSKRLSIFDAIEETDMVNILSHPIYTKKIVQYVHQLQNLYFALTGEELTLKN